MHAGQLLSLSRSMHFVPLRFPPFPPFFPLHSLTALFPSHLPRVSHTPPCLPSISVPWASRPWGTWHTIRWVNTIHCDEQRCPASPFTHYCSTTSHRMLPRGMAPHGMGPRSTASLWHDTTQQHHSQYHTAQHAVTLHRTPCQGIAPQCTALHRGF